MKLVWYFWTFFFFLHCCIFTMETILYSSLQAAFYFTSDLFAHLWWLVRARLKRRQTDRFRREWLLLLKMKPKQTRTLLRRKCWHCVVSFVYSNFRIIAVMLVCWHINEYSPLKWCLLTIDHFIWLKCNCNFDILNKLLKVDFEHECTFNAFRD